MKTNINIKSKMTRKIIHNKPKKEQSKNETKEN
jgi:hypothetical protein